ncbi:hypothetical protein BDN72DRAFT_910444 [Pluteus cervinus]|uniref:Uncharacterized protein n=1 Tax=Pluteus cervinus TaxID=181527 RepID=A0ACD3BJI7_9AGAR|nr:hypothetical protein BDN72DRAFT_910444 [Pluteus cervinus]
MSLNGRTSQIASKFVATYNRLLHGYTPEQISPNLDVRSFYAELLGLKINREYLESKLHDLSRDSCLGANKPFLNELFHWCLTWARTGAHDDSRKENALEILAIITRAVMNKNPSGWEVMEILAGGVAQSDVVFMDLTAVVDVILGDNDAPARTRHQALQLALTFVCAVSQLSPGAYFLRRDLYPSIVMFIKCPATEQFTFEAVLFLAVLANFHKSDAAKLNPYLKRIRECEDEDLMRKVCWASNYALLASIKAYQAISDDSVSPSLKLNLGSVLSALRPDRVLSPAPIDPPRELFKNQPIEATVVLLPVFEFLRSSKLFSKVLLSYFDEGASQNPPPLVLISLSSYLLTHATSTSSPRSIAYADLALHVFIAMVENWDLMTQFTRPTSHEIRLCRQRLPLLHPPGKQRSPVCAFLDCCILWLRHNLHKRLEVASYTMCIRVCHRIVWFLQYNRIRLEYEWKELWVAIMGLLQFLATKLDTLMTTGGVEQLVRETLSLLDMALNTAEVYLPTPQAIHEFIYELVRSAEVLKKQDALLKSLALPVPQDAPGWTNEKPADALMDILEITSHYEMKLQATGARTASTAMRAVTKEIEANGVHGVKSREYEPIKRTEDVFGFARFACADGLALMP